MKKNEKITAIICAVVVAAMLPVFYLAVALKHSPEDLFNWNAISIGMEQSNAEREARMREEKAERAAKKAQKAAAKALKAQQRKADLIASIREEVVDVIYHKQIKALRGTELLLKSDEIVNVSSFAIVESYDEWYTVPEYTSKTSPKWVKEGDTIYVSVVGEGEVVFLGKKDRVSIEEAYLQLEELIEYYD